MSVLYRPVAGLFVLLMLGACGLYYAQLSAQPERMTFLSWQDAGVTAQGGGLYRLHCAHCHGMPGASAASQGAKAGMSVPLHDESGHTWQHPDYALFRLIRDGLAVANCTPVDPQKMPRFKGVMTDTELVAVLSYIKSTWPEESRRYHDEVNAMYGAYNRAVSEFIVIDGEEG